MFGRRGDRVRGPLLPPFSSDPLIKSFHFWPRLRPASHRYQKSKRARQRASIHISIPFSIVGHGEEFMPLEPVIIFAIGESHCSSLSPILDSLRGEERREKSDDAEKRSCHRRQTEKGPTPRKPVWALCKCSAICEYGGWFVMPQSHHSCQFNGNNLGFLYFELVC